MARCDRFPSSSDEGFLKERAPFKPLKGRHRIFLIDHLDRAGDQAANSLLKTLEELRRNT